ncbi:TPM domain-containing protein [Desulfopila sp. IMCC35008]|uniref:TPM domain-containing protein n=1 Tax=Desulfopila sp. IMCC35008 TaxID=2653858 RepID=UPI0013D67551|nr:TPM domain-containing protein [Desulfopila sp. IMCC35008]
MKNLAKKFLTEEEQQKITETVQRMEKLTSGEIVPMVVSTSHDYPVAKAIGAGLLTLPLALLLTSITGSYLWLGPQNMWLFLAYASIFYFPLYKLVGSNPPIMRLFLLARQVEEEVEEAAVSAFYNEGLYRTRQENGILVFISVLEKKVWVLGDRGINERVGPNEWQDIIKELSEGIRDDQQCEAICRSITRIGNVLRHHFPIQEDDHDELHNIIIR